MNKRFARLAVAGSALASGVSAFAVDPATASEALGGLAGTSAAYGPVMFGLAVAAVGIMIGVKWIKRARGAA